MTIQSDFVSRLRSAAGNVIQVVEDVESLYKVAIARGYDQWTDADLADIDFNGAPLTKAELVSMFQRFNELKNYMDNVAVPASDRRTIYNRFRGDL